MINYSFILIFSPKRNYSSPVSTCLTSLLTFLLDYLWLSSCLLSWLSWQCWSILRWLWVFVFIRDLFLRGEVRGGDDIAWTLKFLDFIQKHGVFLVEVSKLFYKPLIVCIQFLNQLMNEIYVLNVFSWICSLNKGFVFIDMSSE